MLGEACKLFFPPLPPRTKPPHQTRRKQTDPLAHSALRGFLRGVGLLGAAWPGKTHSAPICGFALDTARFGCQNPYPRAADGPGESGRTKLRKSNTYSSAVGRPRGVEKKSQGNELRLICKVLICHRTLLQCSDVVSFTAYWRTERCRETAENGGYPEPL